MTLMNIFSKSAVLLSAGMLALAGVANAQLQTYETQTAYSGSVFTFGTGSTLGQTFTNVSAVASMTYNFFAGSGGGGIASATSLSAVFGEWTGSGFTAGTTVSFGTINVPASNSGSWTTLNNGFGTFSTYALEFDLTTFSSGLVNEEFGYLTNSSKTYALMLTNTTGSATNLGLGLTNTDAFAYGATNLGFNDWSFAQIIVAPGDQTLVPIPESSTVATVGSVMLVVFLVNSRMRQRRATPQAVAA